MEIDIDKIRSSPFQPRLVFDVEDLKEEIQKDGLLSPLIVREVGGAYELVDGERRLRALKELGWKEIPVEIREVNDRIARLSVYKLNMIRKDYSVEERARYFKKLHDSGMTFYQIGKDLSVDDSWVLAHINVFKFPEDLQNAVWSGGMSISHIQRLEPIIGANVEDAIKIASEIILRKASVFQTEELVKERKEAIEKARVEAAKKAIGVMTPTLDVKLETPEDLEKAALAMHREAERLRLAELTPEEKDEFETERRRKLEARRREVEEQKRREETERKHREEEMSRRIEEEAKRRASKIEEAERSQIEEEARRKAKEEILSSPMLMQEMFKEAQEEQVEGLVQIETTEQGEPPRKEMVVKEGINYTVGEYECPHCKKHYLIKCNGKRDWVE